jgi:hypothetical protein
MRWRGGRLQTGLLASISAADRQQGRSFTNAQTCSGRRKKKHDAPITPSYHQSSCFISVAVREDDDKKN